METSSFLPYVSIMTTKGELKFLVDTGANKNYISPAHVNIEVCKDEPASTVTNISGQHVINKSASIDIFQIKKKLKFYIFQFHRFFDGLIGYETLRDLKAIVNTADNTLKIGRKIIKMKKMVPEEHKINITEQEFQFINLPVKQKGSFIIEQETPTKHFTILPGLYEEKHGKAIMAVRTNCINKPCEINVNELEVGKEYYEIEKIASKNNTKNYDIRNGHLNAKERQALEEVINKNREVLYCEDDNLTFTHKIKHKIRTTDNIPIHTKSYRYPKVFEEIVRNQVDKLLKDGIVRESISPYTSPVWVVPKKSDASGQKKFRLVIDYRKLNEKTISDRYPIPEITDILDKLGRTCYFSTIDLVSGFHQIQLDDEDIEKTAFSINSGKYEFTRMPFGLKNAPATFQRVMDCVLREEIGICCLVYMDDIIIFSPSFEQHKIDLNRVLKKLKDANLKIQLDKCEFFRKEVQFLGHTVSEDGVRPNQDKIVAIQNWPLPTTEKEIRQFLGLLGYYRRFIKDFAKLVKPLTSLLRKDNDFTITPEIEASFMRCKQILMRDPILIHPDFSKEFILTTDASDYAIGAVLSQGPVGKDRPVAYASRTLNRTEENYSTTEKEFLAMYWAVTHFEHYLWGRKFKLITDHQPLTYSLTNTNKRIFRGKLELEGYDYELIYKPGINNVVADALSRIKPNELNVNSQSEVSNNESESDGATVHSADSSDDYYIWFTEKPINAFKTQLIFKISHIDSEASEEIFQNRRRTTILKPLYTEIDVVNIFKRYLNPKGTNCLRIPIELRQLVQEAYKKHFEANRTYKIFISEILLEDVRLESEQDDLVRITHEYAHRGIKENKAQILSRYYFPQLDKKVRTLIESCVTCKKSKYDRKPPQLIRKSIFGGKPFERVHIDVFFMKGLKWLTIVDSFSKFANIIPLQTRTIVDMKQAISEHIRVFGRPQTFVSDQEPAFTSIDFQGFLNDLGISIHYASNSQSNGIVERFHSTIIELYRTLKAKFPNKSMIETMNLLTDIYNNTIHSVTKRKPREIIFPFLNCPNVQELQEATENLQSAVKVQLHKNRQKYIEKHENKQQPSDVNPNESKYVKISQRQTKDKDPYKIVNVQSNDLLTFQDSNNVKIHKKRIKK